MIMGTRSVRLDDEAESALAEIISRTGSSISEAIKQGLIEYRDKSRQTPVKTPSSFFEQFDLGEGGYISGNARDAKRNIKEKLKSRSVKR